MRFNGIENRIQQDHVVTSATLTLAFRAQSPDFNPATIDIYKLGKNWDENNVTWEATGLGGNWAQAGAQSQDANDLDRSIEKTTTFMGPRSFGSQDNDGELFNVSVLPSWLNEWVNNPGENYGIIIVVSPVQSTDVTFYNREEVINSVFRPLLTLETSLGPQSPAASDGLSAIDEDSIDPWGQIVLSWTDLSDNQDNFVIERSTDGGGNFDFLATVGADVTEYTDPNVEPATEY